MIICQFIFAPGTYDDDFRAWDSQIDTSVVSEVAASYGNDRLSPITRVGGVRSA